MKNTFENVTSINLFKTRLQLTQDFIARSIIIYIVSETKFILYYIVPLMYYSSGSLFTPSCVLIVQRSILCLLFNLLRNFFGSVFGSVDLILFISNFVPKNYTYINLQNLTRHRNFKRYLTLFGYHLLTIFFVYVFERSDWSSLHGLF